MFSPVHVVRRPCTSLVDGVYADPVPLQSSLGPDAQVLFVAPEGNYLFFGRGSRTNWVDASVIEQRRPR